MLNNICNNQISFINLHYNIKTDRKMKAFIVKNTEEIIAVTVLGLLVGLIVFNIITYGIYDTPSFEF